MYVLTCGHMPLFHRLSSTTRCGKITVSGYFTADFMSLWLCLPANRQRRTDFTITTLRVYGKIHKTAKIPEKAVKICFV